jgi:hypothetical protein
MFEIVNDYTVLYKNTWNVYNRAKYRILLIIRDTQFTQIQYVHTDVQVFKWPNILYYIWGQYDMHARRSRTFGARSVS